MSTQPADHAGARPTRSEALLRLLRLLKDSGYRFVTPTPATHETVLGRFGDAQARNVRDALGWSLPFSPEALSEPIFEALVAADVVQEDPEGFRSTIRVSSLGDDLFAHSAFPPEGDDAVFFGPDTYRFAKFLQRELAGDFRPDLLVDVGAGAGAGAVVAAKASGARHVILTDVNPAALALATVNLEAAGVEAQFRLASGVEGLGAAPDLIVANPPFIAGSGQTYSAGGDMHGARLSLDWALAGAKLLAPGGRLLLYTGSAIVGGEDALQAALRARLDNLAFRLTYEEIDPDIFGEQLSAEGYEDVERIAAVGAAITRLR